MNKASKKVQNTYITLMLLQTLAASFIFAINTLFLLDAGLTNAQAFTANAFFFIGQVVFEVPTGVVADSLGRRTSYLLGAITLFISTALYLYLWQIGGPYIGWIISSIILGLGFTFFSGAVEAWLVDALNASGYKGNLESVFAKGQIAFGVAMLIGSFSGGLIAQTTNLGVPYLLRCVFLLASFGVAWFLMHDIGFTPDKGKGPIKEVKNILKASVDNGFKNPSVRWLILAAPFSAGGGTFLFYVSQPYLLELYGDQSAYTVIGVVSALIAFTQILGGLAQPAISKLFKLKSTILVLGGTFSALLVLLIGLSNIFWLALSLFVLWALVFSAAGPFRQSFINSCLPSKQRATILSFDTLMGSIGSAISNPTLGKVADVYSYSVSIMFAALIQAVAIPFLYLAKLTRSPGDPIRS